MDERVMQVRLDRFRSKRIEWSLDMSNGKMRDRALSNREQNR